MSFYTRKGDDGTTGLLGEGRVPKYHLRVEALGTLDESSAALGMARAAVRQANSANLLLEIQRDLYRLMAEVAATPENAARFQFKVDRLQWLEQQIEAVSANVEMPDEFILPGDSPAGATLSFARAVVRRAERRLAELFDRQEIANPVLQQYLNRLSSLLFVLELAENRAAGRPSSSAKK